MNLAEKNDLRTIKDFVAYVETTGTRAEFIDGVIYDMAGGTSNHGLIGANIISGLNLALRDKYCRVFGADTTLEISADQSIVLPDVHVVCGEPVLSLSGSGIHTNAVLVVEVLSPSSMGYDRGDKFHRYMKIPTLQEYLLVDQFQPQVDLLRRSETGFWLFRSFLGMEAVIHLESVGVDLALEDIYRKVKFEKPSQGL